MPLFTYRDQLVNAQPMTATDLEKAGISESELRDLLAQQLSALDSGSSFMVIAREYTNWSDATRRIDILAIEAIGDDTPRARLVVIELKRTKNGGHAELQALRYAAMLSTHTFDDVIHAAVQERLKTDPTVTREKAQSDLLEFLGASDPDDVELDAIPRIILVAQDFKTEITTTALWLMEHMAIDISCYTANLYLQGNGNKVLHLDLLLPLPQQSDYLVKVREKNFQEAKQTKVAKQAPSCKILEQHQLLKPGDTLKLLVPPMAGLVLQAAGQDEVTYLGGGHVRWRYDQQEYSSLSKLTRKICNDAGSTATAFQGPAYWGNANGTLAEQAAELSK